MPSQAHEDRVLEERRKRLKAEKLLAQKADELFVVNKRLAEHADQLSSQVIVQREENQSLHGERVQAIEERDRATHKAIQAERRLWNSLEAIQDGFAVFDKDWCLVVANAAFLRVFQDIETIKLGSHYEDILIVCVEEGLIDSGERNPEDWIDYMIARWESTPIPETTLELFNGAYLQLREVRTTEGDVVCLIENITESIEREADLRRARDEAQAASRAKSAFLAKMSHEIRTPMNGVVGMADLMIEGGLDEEQKLFAETIKNSAESLLIIINDILDYSKLEVDRVEFRDESVDLEAMIIELIRLLSVTLKDKDIQLFSEYPFDLPTHFQTDPGRLRQILTNLLGNAIKFTERGHVAIRISFQKDDDAQNLLAISIADTGIGIPDDKQELIFGDFNQVEDGSSRRYEGTGLGLAITRGLVERMGGTISVESTLGEGSNFVVTLPMKVEPAAKCASLPSDRVFVVIDHCEEAAQARVRELTAMGADAKSETQIANVPPNAVVLWSVRKGDQLPPYPEDIPILLIGQEKHVPEGFRCPWRVFIAAPGTRALILETLHAIMAQAKKPEPVTPILETAPSPERCLRMLAAEDNKTNQLVFRKMLKALSIDLTMVENGRELVDAYKPGMFDMVFTDISMPEMDGLEAAQSIRGIETEKNVPRIPIVAMTAHALAEDEEKILASGIDYYMTKPLKKAKLIAQIKALCPKDVHLEVPE